MAFDALQVKAVEGFNKFYKYDRPSINWRIINMAWAGIKERLGKKKLTNLNVTINLILQVTFYSSNELDNI